MRRKRASWLGAVLVVGLGILASTPVCRTSVIGFCRGESAYQGRYTNYWRAKLREWEPVVRIGFDSGPIIGHVPSCDTTWRHRIPLWQQLAVKYLGIFQDRDLDHPPLLEGDPAAVPVLIELLKDIDPNVREIAADGLEKIGPVAGKALPVLMDGLHDDDSWLKWHFWQAIRAIDPNAAPKWNEVPRSQKRSDLRVKGGIQ